MNRRHNLLFALTAMTVAGLAAAAAPARAERAESGTSCFKWGNDGVLGVWNQGVIGNLDFTNTMLVFCPITRELGENTPGDPLVHTIDRNVGAGVECSFYDVRAYGQDWDWSGWVSTLGSGADNFRTISWGSQGTSEDKFAGFHHFLCHIPPRDPTYGSSVLASYSSGE